jgi:hypothetical protein
MLKNQRRELLAQLLGLELLPERRLFKLTARGRSQNCGIFSASFKSFWKD